MILYSGLHFWALCICDIFSYLRSTVFAADLLYLILIGYFCSKAYPWFCDFLGFHFISHFRL